MENENNRKNVLLLHVNLQLEMPGRPLCKRVFLVIAMTMSLSFASFGQFFPAHNLKNNIPRDYPNKVIPDFDRNKLSYGVSFGLNSSAFTQSLWKDFSPALGLAFGFEASFRDVYAFFNGGMSFGLVRRDFDAQGIWLKGKFYHYGMTDLSIGYNVFDCNAWKICPFIGYAISEFSSQSLDAELGENTLSKFNVIVGISIDYSFFGDIFIMPTTHHQDYLEFNIKLRLYASYHDYGENAKGCSINLMIGASLVKKPLKIK